MEMMLEGGDIKLWTTLIEVPPCASSKRYYQVMSGHSYNTDLMLFAPQNTSWVNDRHSHGIKFFTLELEIVTLHPQAKFISDRQLYAELHCPKGRHATHPPHRPVLPDRPHHPSFFSSSPPSPPLPTLTNLPKPLPRHNLTRPPPTNHTTTAEKPAFHTATTYSQPCPAKSTRCPPPQAAPAPAAAVPWRPAARPATCTRRAPA